ncbi:chemotaxis protein CheD [Acidiphilium sp.]|uniref:chemotaxis protein CheD n=1 Tax=Acidiphilium sp. TaxID=527 RepID=UPI003D093E23
MIDQAQDAVCRDRRINIVQGEQYVDTDPYVCLTTILGSCIAACLWDPVAAVGGMNHFLLPGDRMAHNGIAPAGNAMRYGVYSMELLVNGLLRRGAQRSRLRAKLFGGACMMRGLTDVGDLNASFTERFLRDEGIAVVGGSLRGERGRRIQFWPVSGRARQTLLGQDQSPVFRTERQNANSLVGATSGSLELF